MAEFYSVQDAILKFAYVVGILLCVFFAGAGMEYRKQRIVRIFLGLMAVASLWLFFNLLTFIIADPEIKSYFVRLRFIPISISPGLWLLFCREIFSKPQAHTEPSFIYYTPFILPITVVVACFVPEMHELIAHDMDVFLAWNIPAIDWRVGALTQLTILQSYIILFICVGISLQGLKKEGPQYRSYILMLAIAICMYSIPELVGFFVYREVRFLGLPSLFQMPSIVFIYVILHRQQVVRTFSRSNDKLFESLPVPALLFNRNGGLCLFNSQAAQLLNLSVASMGSSLDATIPRGVDGELPSPGTLAKPYICQIGEDIEDPRYFEVSSSVIDVRGVFGETFVMVSMSEVTEIKRHTMVNQRLMSVLSHDLLGNLSGLVALSNHRHPQHWDLISNTSRSSVDLLKNILLWTSSRGGFYSCEKEPFDLRELAQNVVAQSSSILAPKALTVQGSLLQQPLVAFVDLKMFSAILRNLLTNAARFSPQGGFIHINCHLHGDFVELTVDDQGPGMSREAARSILEADDRPISNDSQGYGIGLYLVRHFVKMHGGKLDIQGNDFGGCRMKISFPAVPPQPEMFH